MLDAEHPYRSSRPGMATVFRKTLLVIGASLIGCLIVLTLLRNASWREPLVLWQDVVRKSPARPRGYYNLGLLYGKMDQIDPAINAFRKALALDPRYADAYNNLGIEYGKLGLYDQALYEFNRAIPLYHEPAGAARAYYNRGKVFMERRLLDRALEDLTTAVTLDPDYADAVAVRSLVLGQIGQRSHPEQN